MAESQPTWNATRIFILIIVAVFLLSTLAFAAIVLYEQFSKDDTAAVTDTSLSDAASSTGEQLEGTQLTGFTPTTDRVTDLQIIDTIEGTGKTVQAGDTITANYTGALVSSGVIFQSSLDTGTPFSSPLSGLITGWQEGIPGMKEGGTRRLVIPAAKAYGDTAQNNIPADSDLVFDIQLISID